MLLSPSGRMLLGNRATAGYTCNMSAAAGWLYLLMWVGVVLANLVMIYVAWWGLFADRPRGRRRCPRCWYDLSHSPGMLCAECGFVAKREEHLSKTRRRYGIAAVAIVGSVALTLFVDHQLSQRDLVSRLPTALLLWTLPLSSEMSEELHSRANAATLSDGQWESLLTRCVEGDWRARPPSDEWIEKYGDFIGLWRGRITGNAALDPLLLRIPPRVDIMARDVWPTDVPPTLMLHVRDWWPTDCQARVHISADPRAADAENSITVHRSSDDRNMRSGFPLTFASFADSAERIHLRVRVDRQRADSGANGWQTVADLSIAVDVRRSAPLAQIFEPVEGEAVDAQIAEVFRFGIVKWSTGPSPARVRINLPATFTNSFNDTALGIAVELVHDGIVARRLNMWWLGGANVDIKKRHYGYEIDYEDETLLAKLGANAESDGRWSMRVRGSPELALRAGNAGKCWMGVMMVPLRVRQADGPAPPRQWSVAEPTVPNIRGESRSSGGNPQRRRTPNI